MPVHPGFAFRRVESDRRGRTRLTRLARIGGFPVEEPFALFGDLPDLAHQVVHLTGCLSQDDLRIQQTCRTNDLFHGLL